MKKAYIVQGIGESTGCRFMTELLIKCGCSGKSGHTQDFQNSIGNYDLFKKYISSNNINNFVIRFSFPHGKHLPEINKYYDILKMYYDKVYIILTTRSWICQEIGTTKGKHLINNPIKSLPLLEDRITFAYKKIFSDLFKIDNGNYKDFVVINIGDILTYPKEHIKYLFNKINIDIPLNFDYSFIKLDTDKKRIEEYKVL